MRTIYLRFADRDAALARLVAVLGHELEPEGGMLPTSGRWQGERFDLDEVGVLHVPLPLDANEGAVSEALPGWHINLLWWGQDDAVPDFGGGMRCGHRRRAGSSRHSFRLFIR